MFIPGKHFTAPTRKILQAWYPTDAIQNKFRLTTELKLSQFTEDIILYTGKPKYSTKRLMGLIREFGKVAVYKANKHKLMVLININ